MTLFVSLGIWQWGRGEEKAALLKLHAQEQTAMPLEKNTSVRHLMMLKVWGHFDNRHSFLLDNQFNQHHIGFDVLTPFQLETGKWLLVDRGWVAAKPDRKVLPQIAPIKGRISFKGRAYFPSSKNRVLNNRLDNEGQWPLIIERVTTDNLGKRLGVPLYPFILRLDKGASFGYVREWKTVSMKPERHYGYAFQWFSFALIVLILFVYLNREKKSVNQ
jgi:surfeit locus 1 family protein